MSGARITEIHVEGLRTLKDVRLKLDGLTVLIGENGAGKSSLIEACEVIRRLVDEDFLVEFCSPHGGVFALFRDDAPRLRLTVHIAAALPQLGIVSIEYSISLVRYGAGATIEDEHLWVRHPGEVAAIKAIERDRRVARFWNGEGLVPLGIAGLGKLALTVIGQASSRHPAIDIVRDALRAIDVRQAIGTNLADVYFALREQSDGIHWEETMDLLRLGLGVRFEEVKSIADPGGGAHAMAIKWRGRDLLMTASALSNGQVAFLAFVGIYRLPRQRSLLAIDEPELHLHPGLLTRVVQMLASMSEAHPVLVATHSDRLLETLEDPAASVRVCDLHGDAVRLRRLDRAALGEWIGDYRGVGSVRSDGHLIDVIAEGE